MEKRKKILTLGAVVITISVSLTIFWIFRNGKEKKVDVETPEIKVKQVKPVPTEKKKKENEAIQRKKEKISIPLEIIEFGWRPVSRTLPNPGFIWEWAVELENKTPLHLKLIIKFELLDENGNLVGESIGGEDLAPEERKIVIGKASSSDRIMMTRKMRVSVKASPSNRKNTPEEIEESWRWETPFEVSEEKELGFSR